MSDDQVLYPPHSPAPRASRRWTRRAVLYAALAVLGAVPVGLRPAAGGPGSCVPAETHGLVQSATAAEHRVLEASAARRLQSATAAEHRVLQAAAARQNPCR